MCPSLSILKFVSRNASSVVICIFFFALNVSLFLMLVFVKATNRTPFSTIETESLG